MFHLRKGASCCCGLVFSRSGSRSILVLCSTLLSRAESELLPSASLVSQPHMASLASSYQTSLPLPTAHC